MQANRSAVVILLASLPFLPVQSEAQSYLIGTVAGGGLPDTPAPALSVSLGLTQSVAVDTSGNVYLVAGNCVFKVDNAGTLTRVAGVSTALGYSGDGGPAARASLNLPFTSEIAVDSAGNLYIADSGNNRIRKVTAATGIITTVAGNGNVGYSGDGAAATSAQLDTPGGVAVDNSGNLYIADSGNYRIRKVTAGTGIITTVAGTGEYGFSGDGGPATSANLDAFSVAVDRFGNLYIVDFESDRIRKVSAGTGVISTFAGNGTVGFSGDGGPAVNAELDAPLGIAADSAGNVYIADLNNSVIRKVAAATGIITTVAGNGINGFTGDGGPATSAEISNSESVAVDGFGNLYIADTYNDRIRKVAAATGIITTIAGSRSSSYSGDGGPATSAQIHAPGGLAVDSSGNLFIADSGNSRVRKVAAATGVITTVAGNGIFDYSGDGGPATSAELDAFAVAVDGFGNLFIVDTSDNRIRKVTAATGIITTVAGGGTAGLGDGGPATSAQLIAPRGVAVDGSGNLFIVDDVRVRKVTASNRIITTVAGGGTAGLGDGGPATSAQLFFPQGIAVDSSGNLFIADQFNSRVRKVAAGTGVITTIAGNGTPGYAGDGGPAASAEINDPVGVAVDRSGNLYIADENNGNVRRVAAATGIITTLAGSGSNTYFSFPDAVAVGSSGQVFIATIGSLANVVTLINDSGRPASEVTAGNAASSDHLTFNLLIENSSGSSVASRVPLAPHLGRDPQGAAGDGSVGGTTALGTITITEILARDSSAASANGAVVQATLPPTWIITGCYLANGGVCSAVGGSSITATYASIASGQSPGITLVADGPASGATEVNLSATSGSTNLATASFSQSLLASPGADITPAFQGPSGIAAGPIQYTMFLTNSGGTKLAGDPINVTVTLDPALVSTSVQSDPALWTCTQTKPTFTCVSLPALASEGALSFTVKGTVPPSAGGRIISSFAKLTFGGQVAPTQTVSTNVTGGQTIPFFSGELYLGGGVYFLKFPNNNLLGYYSYVASSILYHYDMGYQAFIPGSGADIYLYDFTTSHWLYTSSTFFPYLYDFTLKSWIYYFPDTRNPGHYTTNPRYFSNLTTGQIFMM